MIIGNLQAFLHVIREGESHQSDDAYTIIYGGAHFNAPPWRHPWHGIPTTQGAKACGAYGFLGTTWARAALQLGLGEDFSPPSQDAGAVADIGWHAGATEAIERGDVAEAIRLLAHEWVSLPGLGLARAMMVFKQYGGSADSAPGTPPEVTTEGGNMGVAIPLLLQLVPQVLQLFSGRAQAQIAKATGSDPAVAAQFMQNLIAQIGAATAVPVVDNTTAVQAVGALTALPPPEKASVVAALEVNSLEYIDKLAPLLDKMAEQEKALWAARDKSADAASARGRQDRVDIAPVLVRQGDRSFNGAFICIVALLGVQMYFAEDHKPDATLTGFLGLFAYGVIRLMDRPSAYRFGGAFESSTTIDTTKSIIGQTLDERRKSQSAG